MTLGEALYHLVKGASYRGSVDDSLKASYDNLEWLDSRPKPSWEECVAAMDLLEVTRERINTKTDELIAAGLTYQGIKFPLDIEHQMDYKGAYDLRTYITYPYTIKGEGSNYLTFANESEFTTFILSGFSFISNTLRYGWTLKDSLSSLTHDQLAVWKDPRDDTASSSSSSSSD